ncbi:glycosyltransferase [Roseospirillum parvum]|uniref:Glycosyltransferase involved in cell wall bisynthesis n=1 Tax=Roseospirillum parvum TaxID=83401 RepID=A0A1G8EJK8_9PROT|nr:glycosyltransferase [Roseospirillum parvum]SDH70010.1 Glycosyltransferase involved in cell wall bisynthesis [Roseospirillum parvum]
MSLSVLHLITGLQTGGAERMLVKLLAADAGRDTVTHRVASLTGPGRLGAEVEALGVPLHDLGLARGRPHPRALLGAVRLIRRHRPDVIQSWLYHADLLALVAAGLTGQPRRVIWNLRCSDMEMARYGRLSALVRGLCARLSPLPGAVIANAQVGRQVHEKLGYRPRQWAVIPNGFDTTRFAPDPDLRATTRRQLGLDDGHTVIALTARVDPQKNHPGLLDAFARVAPDHPHARLLLAGRGTQDLDLPDVLADKVLRLGERTDIPALLNASDLAILPSAYGEGFSNALGEAMACGLPAIATQVGDSAHIIGPSGWITPPNDTHALAETLHQALATPAEERQKRGHQARQRILDNWTLPTIQTQYHTLWLQVAAAAARSQDP